VLVIGLEVFLGAVVLALVLAGFLLVVAATLEIDLPAEPGRELLGVVLPERLRRLVIGFTLDAVEVIDAFGRRIRDFRQPARGQRSRRTMRRVGAVRGHLIMIAVSHRYFYAPGGKGLPRSAPQRRTV